MFSRPTRAGQARRETLQLEEPAHQYAAPVDSGSMKIRLKRKFADVINGIDLSKAHQGEILEVSARDAEILVAEGWAERADAPPAREKAHDRPSPPRKSRKPRKSTR